ncbi:Uncharacterised protein [Salmonella enterica subsp. indica]|uniref:Uncharacterized protein n=1 Tax=Salmonella enterica subsp. indica TaxID=59207 RepID=A0A379XVC5_SALER|nr:Uncharacterised protein [Salmonella enterica subsp. indica]
MLKTGIGKRKLRIYTEADECHLTIGWPFIPTVPVFAAFWCDLQAQSTTIK